MRTWAILLGSAAIAGIFVIRAAAQTSSVAALIEVRPAGARLVGPGADLMSEALAVRVQQILRVVRVEKYLFVGVRDRSHQKEIFVIAGYTPRALPRVNCHNLEGIKMLDGRLLRPEDAGKLIAMVGTGFAAAYRDTARVGRIIPLLPLAAETRDIPASVRSAQVRVVGRFAFARPFALGERKLLLPLDTVQRLFGLRGKVSRLFVTVDSPAARDGVAEAIREALGESFDVVYPSAGGMR